LSIRPLIALRRLLLVLLCQLAMLIYLKLDVDRPEPRYLCQSRCGGPRWYEDHCQSGPEGRNVVLMKLVRRMEGERHVQTDESDVDVQLLSSDIPQSELARMN